MFSLTEILQWVALLVGVLVILSAFAGAAALDDRAVRGFSSNPLMQLIMACGVVAAGWWFIKYWL